jgi:hypothetical protein
MKVGGGPSWSVRAPSLFVAVLGLAVLGPGCIIDGGTSRVDSDLDTIDDVFDDCPLQPETFNGFQDADGCPDSTTGCQPDLTISWRILSNLDGAVLSCSEAGNADTVTAWIDGGGLTGLTAFEDDCLASATQGSFVALLPSSGTYNVSLELTSGLTLLSETSVLVQPVDCSGLSATPRADLLVNF